MMVLGWFGRRSLAVALFVSSLALSIGLFLFEIYSLNTDSECPGSRPNSMAYRCHVHDGYLPAIAAAARAAELRLSVARDVRRCGHSHCRDDAAVCKRRAALPALLA